MGDLSGNEAAREMIEFGATNSEIAAQLGLNRITVVRIRHSWNVEHPRHDASLEELKRRRR